MTQGGASTGARLFEAAGGRGVRPRDTRAGVLIVDDSASFRRAARDVVSATPGFVAIAEASSGEEALRALESIDPCLVLLDVKMGGIDGIETARRITARYPRPTVVLVSVEDPASLQPRVESSGAAALVDKRDFGPALLTTLWATHGPGE
jgi:two-component system, NarL family, invasion response regulator UvrY